MRKPYSISPMVSPKALNPHHFLVIFIFCTVILLSLFIITFPCCLQIIKSDHPDLGWIAVLIQVFVAISITVSFLTIGAGMKHMGKLTFESTCHAD